MEGQRRGARFRRRDFESPLRRVGVFNLKVGVVEDNRAGRVFRRKRDPVAVGNSQVFSKRQRNRSRPVGVNQLENLTRARGVFDFEAAVVEDDSARSVLRRDRHAVAVTNGEIFLKSQRRVAGFCRSDFERPLRSVGVLNLEIRVVENDSGSRVLKRHRKRVCAREGHGRCC